MKSSPQTRRYLVAAKSDDFIFARGVDSAGSQFFRRVLATLVGSPNYLGLQKPPAFGQCEANGRKRSPGSLTGEHRVPRGGAYPQGTHNSADVQSDNRSMAPSKGHDYTDGRPPWDWPSKKYPPEARKCINREAAILAVALVLLVICAGVALCFSGSLSNVFVAVSSAANSPVMYIDARTISVFLCGSVGGTTFSIKWLVHSVSKR